MTSSTTSSASTVWLPPCGPLMQLVLRRPAAHTVISYCLQRSLQGGAAGLGCRREYQRTMFALSSLQTSNGSIRSQLLMCRLERPSTTSDDADGVRVLQRSIGQADKAWRRASGPPLTTTMRG